MRETLLDIVRQRADKHPDRKLYCFLPKGEAPDQIWSYGDLDRRARAAAAWLQQYIKVGDRVLISCTSLPDWITAFFGCVYAGGIAVPMAPLHRESNISALAMHCGATLALLDVRIDRRIKEDGVLASINRQVVDAIPLDREDEWRAPALKGDSLALIQYTSGSTGTPKGATLSHGNIVANQRMIQSAFRHDEMSVFVSWLPFFHDMGLMGTVIQPLFLGTSAVLMPPTAFLERPVRWLRAISAYGAHTSGGPNFAYTLCHQSIRDEDMEGLDLSSWRVAFNGAEPIHAVTLEQFSGKFSRVGFRAENFFPCYGLAEASLFVAGHRRDLPPQIIELGQELPGLDPDSPASAKRTHRAVSCGRPAPGVALAMMADDMTPTGNGQVGEICISGPNVTEGYWPRETPRSSFFSHEGALFFRTGDLGMLRDGELFVLGRRDDLIIIRGRNFYPHDLECVASGSHTALHAEYSAAFTIQVGEETCLVVVQGTRKKFADNQRREVISSIRSAVAEHFGLTVDFVVLVPRRAIPMTTSGKVRRKKCRELLENGDLGQLDERFNRSGLESEQASLAWLLDALARILRIPPQDVAPLAAPTALGIDSLGAAKICSLAYEQFGLEIPLASVLEARSIESLAVSISNGSAAPTGGTQSQILRNDDLCVASARQRAMWLFQQHMPESCAYQLAVAARVLSSPLDPARLVAAIGGIVNRHPALLSVFSWKDGALRQQLRDFVEQDIQIRSAQAMPLEEFDELIDYECRKPFDLERGPNFRVLYFRGGPRGDVLLFAAHHIVVDLWSFAVLLRELDALLGDAPQLLPAERPDLELRFGATEAMRIAAFEAAGGTTRVLERLSGAQPLEFPPSPWEAGPAHAMHQIATARFEISEATTRSLRELAKRCSATLYEVLLSAYAVVLHRYCSADDFTIGSPVWGRGPEHQNAIGCFVNTIVVRCDLTGNPSFVELVARMHQSAAAALGASEYPYSMLAASWRKQTRQMAPAEALFTLYLVPEPLPADIGSFVLGRAGSRLNLDNIQLEVLPLKRHEFDFPFDLAIAECGPSLVGYLATAKRRIPAELGMRMAQHFTRILERVAQDDGWRISSGRLLSAQECGEVERWNEPGIEEASVTLLDLFDLQAQRNPDGIAVYGESGSVTYAELRRQSERICSRLAQASETGVVGLLLPNGPLWTTAMLGAMRARCPVVPLDPADPVERLAAMAAAADVRTLVSSVDYLQTAAGVASQVSIAPVLLLGESGDLTLAGNGVTAADSLPLECPRFTHARPALNDVVYIVFTSGSTGLPKGVPITHGNLEHLVRWLVREFQIGPDTRSLQSLPVCFDFGLEEVFATLLGGGTLYAFPPEQRRDPDHYLNLLDQHHITMAFWTPSLASALLSRDRKMASLQVILLGGETVERPLIKRLRESVRSDCRIFNGYGPTEAAINSSMHEIRNWDDAADWSRSIPIGKRSGRSRLYILNQHGSLMPIGALGELYIGGPGVASGYLSLPALTAGSFFPDPHAPSSGSVMYKTGDRARWLPDGGVEFIGRLDRQVKLRGYRIELDEVEHALRRAPGVRDAAVVVFQNAAGPELRAFVVVLPERSLEATQQFARRQLPSHMVPSQWMRLDALPTTTNGKIDRSALAELEQERAVDSLEGFQSPTELEVQSVWQAVTGVAPVPREVSFLDFGGHSLAAIAAHQELQKRLAVKFPLATLFEYPTVAQLARFLNGHLKVRPSDYRDAQHRAAWLRTMAHETRRRLRRGHE